MNIRNYAYVCAIALACLTVGAETGCSSSSHNDPAAPVTSSTTDEPTTDEPTTAGPTTPASHDINLSDYDDGYTIVDPGTYNITGKSKRVLTVNAPGEVIINFKNVDIDSDSVNAINISERCTGAVLNFEGEDNSLASGKAAQGTRIAVIQSAAPLKISGSGSTEVAAKGTNVHGVAMNNQPLSVLNGDFQVDAVGGDCIYCTGSKGSFALEGGDFEARSMKGCAVKTESTAVFNEGMADLAAFGSKDPVISAEKGYKIGSVSLTATGQENIQMPDSSTAQNTLVLRLDTPTKSGASYKFIDSQNRPMVEDSGDDSFQTFIISAPMLYADVYKLVFGKDKVPATAGGETAFNVPNASGITKYGNII